MGHLDGRVALITGGAGGLGSAYATALARDGAAVVINDLDGTKDSPAQRLRDEIAGAGGRASVLAGDVADWSFAQSLVAHAVESHGGLHVVVNNAGLLRDSFLAGMSEQSFDRVVAVHLKGTFNLSRHAAAYWRTETKSGRHERRSLINTTSGSGLHANPGQANYAAAKAGIVALTQVAAKELARYGVAANCIAPVARTPMTASVPQLARPIDADAPFDPLAPAGIAPLVQLLARSDCRFSGHVFRVIGDRLGVYRGWQLAHDVRSDTAWTVGLLAEVLAEVEDVPLSVIPWHDESPAPHEPSGSSTTRDVPAPTAGSPS